MIKPIGKVPAIEPSMTLDGLIESLTYLRDSGVDGDSGIAIATTGEENNFTTTRIQVTAPTVVIDDVTKPCVLLAVAREPKYNV